MTVERFEPETFKAAADLSAKQYFAVEPTANAFEVNVCNNAGDKPLGILQSKPKAGEAAAVACRPGDICRAITDGNAAAIAPGDWLGTDGNGKLVKKTTDKDFVLARALEASAADGTIISVLLLPNFLAV